MEDSWPPPPPLCWYDKLHRPHADGERLTCFIILKWNPLQDQEVLEGCNVWVLLVFQLLQLSPQGLMAGLVETAPPLETKAKLCSSCRNVQGSIGHWLHPTDTWCTTQRNSCVCVCAICGNVKALLVVLLLAMPLSLQRFRWIREALPHS